MATNNNQPNKKIVLLIVEGPSDESALKPILKKHFRNDDVRFHVIHGDLTADWDYHTKNIEKELVRIVNLELRAYKLFVSDILKIVHLIDTDGAYIPSNDILEDKNLSKNFIYTLHNISGSSKQIIKNRNDGKQAKVDFLCTKTHLSFDIICNTEIEDKSCQEEAKETLPKVEKYNCPYEIYYFSRNIEHVLHNKIEELTDDNKEDLADDFADKYAELPLEDFLTFISDKSIAVEGNYDETWDFIKQDTNSLKRYSNFHLLFR